jgi:hypothetical protein
MVNNPDKYPDPRVTYGDNGLSFDGNNEFHVGCVAVAMGQVMAYHEWPDRCSLPGYWRILSVWDYNPDSGFPPGPTYEIYYLFSKFVYDWEAMKAKPRVTDWGMSNNGKDLINVLLYEAGVNVGMRYGKGGSRASADNVVPAFHNLGYDVSESAIRDYNFNTIAASIDRKLPVIISAASHVTTTTTTTYHWIDLFHWFPQTKTDTTYSGHAWVIDDYHVSSETFTSGGKLFQRPVYLVHCNLGWSGQKNGWYADGLFDTRSGTVVDDTPLSVIPGTLRSTSTVGDNYVYKYRIRIIPFLKKPQNA